LPSWIRLDLTLLEESDIPNVTVAVMPKTQPHVDRFDKVVKLVTGAGLLVHQERFWQALSKTINPSFQHRNSDAAYKCPRGISDCDSII
jgi:hypothetical protein